MNQKEQNLLRAAYEHYQRTGNSNFTYFSPDDTDWVYSLIAAQQLYKDNLIDSDLYYVVDDTISHLPGNIPPITFCLTEKALNELSRWWDFKG